MVFKIAIIALVGAVITGVILIFGLGYFSLTNAPSQVSEVPATSLDSSSVQIMTEDIQVPEATGVRTPDGTKTLVMEKIKGAESNNYSFFAVDNESGAENLIFEKDVPANSSFELLPNAWSPDNKYVFIKENSGESFDYLVFDARGTSFSEGFQYISVMPIFSEKGGELNLTEITGWDSPTLLHVFTNKENGERGPSFWFEVPSTALIQLAHR